MLTAIAMPTLALSGCSRLQNNNKTNIGPDPLIFRNNDSLPHSIRWTLRYLGRPNKKTKNREANGNENIEEAATVYLKPDESRILTGLLDEEGPYVIDVRIQGARRQFNFAFPTQVNGIPIVHGVEVSEEGNLGFISVSVDSLR